MNELSIQPFAGLNRVSGSEAPLPYACDMLNVRLADGVLRPRYGYRQVAAAPEGTRTVWGFERLSGYDENNAPREEWVVVKDFDGDVRPYSVHPLTGAHTEITSAGVSLSLAASAWRAVAFGSTSYWINPLSPTSVYKHDIDVPSSWSAMSNVTDITPPSSVGVDTLVPEYDEHHELLSTDTLGAVTCGNGSSTWTASRDTANGNRLKLTSNDYPTGSYITSWLQWSVTWTSARDWTGVKSLALELHQATNYADAPGNDGFSDKAADNYLIIENSVGTVSASLPIVVKGDNVNGKFGTYVGWVDLSSVPTSTLATAKKITVRHGIYKTGVTSIWLKNLWTGGMLYTDQGRTLQTAASGTTPEMLYAARYTEGATNGQAATVAVPATTHLGERKYEGGGGLSPYLGSRLNVTVPKSSGGDFTSAATIELYRKVNGEWRRVATGPNSDRLLFTDGVTDSAIAADAAYATYPKSDLEVSESSVFESSGVVGAFSMRNHFVWLYPGGVSNVRHSAIGDPERQYSVTDDTGDETRGANYTLADGLDDEPICGASYGAGCVIFGHDHVYVQTGSSPTGMTPCRRILGAPPIAGRFACAPLTIEGVPGVAYVDRTMEAVWWISAAQDFAEDTQTRPIQLSAELGTFVREFLYDGQALASVDELRMDVDVATGTLWLVMGERAILRRSTGAWEPHSYELGTYEYDETVSDGYAEEGDGAVVTHNLATSGWVNTGLRLRMGSVVSYTAVNQGTCTWNGSTDASPSGSSWGSGFPIAGTPLATGRTSFSLVFAISETDPGFGASGAAQGASSGTIEAMAWGYLWLGFNDLEDAYGDNTGAFKVVLNVDSADNLWYRASFTGTDETAITSYTSDTLHTHSVATGFTAELDGNGYLISGGDGTSGIWVVGSPPSGNYDVECWATVPGLPPIVSGATVYGRRTGTTWYKATLSVSTAGVTTVSLVKSISGATTTLGSTTIATAYGERKLVLKLRDGIQEVGVDGVGVLSTTDTAIPSSSVGVGYEVFGPTETGGMELPDP